MEDKERTEVVLNAIASDVNHDIESKSATEVGAGPIELARRVVGVMVLNDNRPNKHAREERDDKDATPLDTGLEPGRTSRPVSDDASATEEDIQLFRVNATHTKAQTLRVKEETE